MKLTLKTPINRFASRIFTRDLHLSRRSGSTQTDLKPSYVYGEGSKNKSLTYTTVGQEVDRMSDLYGDREAVVVCHQGIRKTFTQYKNDIDQLAIGLLAVGLQRGDRVAIWCPNQYEWILSQFATAKLGVVLTSLNPAYQTTELEDCLAKVNARGIIMADKFKTQNYYSMLSSIAPEVTDSRPETFKCRRLPSLDKVIMVSDEHYPGTFAFKDVMQAGGSDEKKRMDAIEDDLNADDTIMIQFTSGTTAKPKAVKMSHHNIINGCRIQADRLAFDNPGVGHRLCTVGPLFHVISSIGHSLNGVINGLCNIYPSPSFNPEHTLKAIQEERCTMMTGTPTMFIDIMNHPDFQKTDLSSMKYGVMGGAPCLPELVKRITSKMNCPGITLGYGSTEMCGAVFIHKHDDTFEEKISSEGRIYDFMEAKIVDDEDRIVPMGTPGEICVRGYKVMSGYWNDDDKTAQNLKNGWFYSGDIGILMENKTVKIVDRKKDMIIRGGENISPREIEDCLTQHSKIQEVYVIGVPDDRMGEEICVWIKIVDQETLTEDDVQKYCKGKIAHYKIPRYVKFVSEFPRTPVGKVQKTLMREAMREERL